MTTDFVCLDSETCGLFGPIVLLQWGEGFDGAINLHSPFKRPIQETLDILEWLTTKRILGFNLAFDWFKVQQAWTTLKLLGKRVGYSERPIDHIDAYALCEPEARDGPCLKPLGAFDLMLHARKGPWQSLMNRDPITVRRVPIGIAPLVIRELEARINLPDIFFAKRKNKKLDEYNTSHTKWRIKKIKTADGWNPDFVNIELEFNPSSSLKALATHELNLDPSKTLVFSDVEVDRRFLPNEEGVAPYALAVGRPGAWNGAWPDVVEIHSDHWEHNELAREYATKDIVYPRALYDKWGRPEFDDNDSILACLAGSTRWKGFSVNLDGIGKLKKKAQEKMTRAPRAPSEVIGYLKEVLDPIEQIVLQDKHTKSLTTKKVVLEEIRKLKSCHKCIEGIEHESPRDCKLVAHAAAERANLVLGSRQGKKEEEIYEKLELAKRFHASVNIIGARSSRQSGGQVTEGKKIKKSGGLNPQGINKKKIVREQFPLAFTDDLMRLASEAMRRDYVGHWEKLATHYTSRDRQLAGLVGLHIDEWAQLGYPIQTEKLVGGDFDKFEVCIADAYYQDPQLRIDLTAPEPPCERELCKYSNPKCSNCKHDHHEGKPCEDKDCNGCTNSVKVYVPRCSACTGKPSKPGSVKIHAIIGAMAYVGRTYWEVRATDGKDTEELKALFPDWPVEHWVDLYTRAKSAFFALLYFGDENTLASRLGIPPEDGLRVFNLIMARYPVMAEKREEFYESFCPVRQPDGGQVFWSEPDDYGESMNGFKRFVTLENQILKALFDLAEDIPPEWREIKVKVVRRDKVQTIAGAVRSALYGAAFGLQGANMRAMGNHKIQATGAIMTKELQRGIWDHQPCGIHPWFVRPLNVHDELPTALHPGYEERVAKTQADYLAKGQNLVPLLAMKWKAMPTWAGK